MGEHALERASHDDDDIVLEGDLLHGELGAPAAGAPDDKKAGHRPQAQRDDGRAADDGCLVVGVLGDAIGLQLVPINEQLLERGTAAVERLGESAELRPGDG